MGKQVSKHTPVLGAAAQACGIYRAVLLCVAVLYITTAAVPAVLGYRPYTVLSGSMEPEIPTGALAYIDCGETDVHTGDIVAYSLNSDISVIHRIVSETDDGLYITKGDNNRSTDISPVRKSQIIGKMVFSVPLMGKITLFIRSGKGFALCLCAIAVSVVSSVIPELSQTENSTKEKETDNL